MSSHRPFQCHICQSRFTRNENLKRHAALHSRSQQDALLRCSSCNATFSRSDLRLRHLKRKHPEQTKRRALSRAAYEKSPTDAASLDRAKNVSTSPISGQHSFGDRQPDDEGALEDASPRWNTALPSPRPHFDSDRQHHREESLHLPSTSSMTPEDDASLLQQSTYKGRVEPEETQLEQSFLLDVSVLKPSHHHFDPCIPSPPSGPCTADPASSNSNPQSSNILTPTGWAYLQEDWFPSNSEIVRGVHLYFCRVSPFVPFLHYPTFDATSAAPHLLLSMLCLAYQHDDDSDDEAPSGVRRSVWCFHRARTLLAAGEKEDPDAGTHDITVIQSYLLLQICAMMYLCGKDSAYGLQMHSKLIFLARSSGIMQPLPHNAAATGDLDSMWLDFIRVESRKRTLFVLHHVDALWYQFLSIPRSLSHLEIKHDLPCPEDSWAAASSAQWAHRQLLVQHSPHLVPYAQAVRRFLSAEPDVDSLRAFDPYGAINIAQFLISSAREVTGWSTMTGQLSIERFEPLRSSLDALRPFICPSTADAELHPIRTTHSVLCEATWETAMIELQMWSPSHTGGIVASSVDAMLQQSTYHTPSCELLVETNTAKAIQPHVDWFLHYLDVTQGLELDSEPPWVTLYAYKACMIAWRLVCGAMSGAMQVVGVRDGDAHAALAWARKVFQRRRRRKLGVLILECLDTLEGQLRD